MWDWVESVRLLHKRAQTLMQLLIGSAARLASRIWAFAIRGGASENSRAEKSAASFAPI